jgi:hypothetical protein
MVSAETIQFYLSKTAAVAVDIDRLKFRARSNDRPSARSSVNW